MSKINIIERFNLGLGYGVTFPKRVQVKMVLEFLYASLTVAISDLVRKMHFHNALNELYKKYNHLFGHTKSDYCMR